MKKTRLITLLIFPAITAVLICSGCGRKVEIKDERKVVLQESRYETLWVEPQIVMSDSLFTLIRSDRIDSARIDPGSMPPQRKASVEIRITEPYCNASVALVDASLRPVYPLLVRNLSAGFYRLTLNVDRFRKPGLPPGSYFLRVDYCDRLEMALVTVE